MKNKIGPFIKTSFNTSFIMKRLITALLPIIMFSFYNFGIRQFFLGNISAFEMFRPLILIIVGSLTSVIIESIYCKFIFKNNLRKFLNNSYALLPGLFLSLVLPVSTPIHILILGTAVATIFGKLIFGGFGKNIFNPALIGYLFIFVTFPMSLVIDSTTGATALTSLAKNNFVTNFSKIIENHTFFDMFIGHKNGALGEVSAILIIGALIYLSYKNIIKYRISLSYITTVFVMFVILGIINNMPFYFGFYNILIGGLLFGATFMATDPVTSPIGKKAQIIYGIILGILTFFFRTMNLYAEGVMISILIGNFISPFIDKLSFLLNTKIKVIVTSLIGLIVILSISLFISFDIYNKLNVSDEDKKDQEYGKNFKIINEIVEDDIYTFEVSNLGYVDDIIMKIKIQHDKIISIEVISESESMFNEIKKEDYINKVIETSGDIDSISGVTYTSQAIKDAALDTLKYYNEQNNTNIKYGKNFKVINTTTNRSTTIYRVSNLGYVEDIILDISIENNIITNIKVIKENESMFNKIKEENYIKKVIETSGDIDSISGVTYTSQAIKDAALDTIIYHKQNRN
ncbi:MAG: RnfABCDGE type electron transport complex subunit D [Bacilli bacterium]